jgi:hypothetical protein
MESCQKAACQHHVIVEFFVGSPIFAERGRGSQQHNDWGLDNEGERKDNPTVGSQVDLRLCESGNDRAENGQFHAHQQPACSEGQPNFENIGY